MRIAALFKVNGGAIRQLREKTVKSLVVSVEMIIFAQDYTYITTTMKGKYLNPKADLTFKKVFGEHPDLVMSLLNALLPLDEGKQIEHVEYLTPEMVPENPGKKNSIVDVRCRETGGRHFIVEMQMRSNLFACLGKNWKIGRAHV